MRNETLLCTGTMDELSYGENLVFLWLPSTEISLTQNCQKFRTKTYTEKEFGTAQAYETLLQVAPVYKLIHPEIPYR